LWLNHECKQGQIALGAFKQARLIEPREQADRITRG
jgi:hypothetical protein